MDLPLFTFSLLRFLSDASCKIRIDTSWKIKELVINWLLNVTGVIVSLLGRSNQFKQKLAFSEFNRVTVQFAFNIQNWQFFKVDHLC